MFDHEYPYTNLSEMNLDYILAQIKKFRSELDTLEDKVYNRVMEQIQPKIDDIQNDVITLSDNFDTFKAEIRQQQVDFEASVNAQIADLENKIAELFPLPNVPAGEILTNARQADAVKRALEYMDAAMHAMTQGMTPDIVLTETEGAMSALGELDGRTVREDVTNRIFQRFCVGK